MPADAVFRIASQTKAVTSVAVMILFEEGKILLGEPVSKYIPEFAKTTVAVPEASKKGLGYKIVPAKRPITVRDLLTHSAGISYGDGPARGEELGRILSGPLAVVQGGAETDQEGEDDDDPVEEMKAHGYRPFAENAWLMAEDIIRDNFGDTQINTLNSL